MLYLPLSLFHNALSVCTCIHYFLDVRLLSVHADILFHFLSLQPEKMLKHNYVKTELCSEHNYL